MAQEKLIVLENLDTFKDNLDLVLQTALDSKVDKVSGKGLSTEDYTTTEKNKLGGIAEGAEVNIQSDWEQTTSTADDYIKNKPNLGTAAAKNYTDTYSATGTDLTTGKAVANALSDLLLSEVGGTNKYIAKISQTNGLVSAAYGTIDTTVTSESSNLITSGAVYTAISNLPNPMVFKGTLGAQADNPTITALPVDGSATIGDTYKVITDGTYASVTAKVGDMFTCLTKTSSANTWTYIPSGDDSIVIANPSGTATDELEKISIDNTIYNIKDTKAREDITEVDTESTTPFLYRQTPHNADGVFLDELVGGSVAWNQLVQNGNFASTSKWLTYNSSYSVSGNVATITVTSAGTGSIWEDINVIAGHKYLLMAKVKSNDGSVALRADGAIGILPVYKTDTSFASVSTIANADSTGNFRFILTGFSPNQVFYAKDAITTDLTQMFGTTIADYIYSLEQATAGSGIAWLKSHGFFTKDYYPYNAGELISVKTSGKRYVGFNKYDEEWEIGDIDNNGQPTSSTTLIRTKNFNPCIGGETYYYCLNSSASATLYIKCYDENKSFISPTLSANKGNTFTVPQNAKYFKFVMGSAYGTTYNHDICINISKTEGTPKNGDYVPYEEHTYDISNIDLRGIPKLVDNALVYDGDTYDSNGDVTRKYGIVDLGTLNWYHPSGNNADVAYAVLSDMATNSSDIPLILCPKYTAKHIDYWHTNGVITVGYAWTPNGLNICDSNFADKTEEQIAAYLSGVYLVYPLATPTTETTDPYTNPQICDKDGTEEFIDDRTVPVPVGHNSRYADLPAIMDGDYLSYMARNFASEEYVDTELDTKVDKVSGKGLSTNDYTNEDKALVATIPDKADSADVEGTKTVSGNPINLTDASETYAESLVVELEPIQDLHGQSAPYVGGAGKNKFNPVKYASYLQSDGKYRMTGAEASAVGGTAIPDSCVNKQVTFSAYFDLSKEASPTYMRILVYVGSNYYYSDIQSGAKGTVSVTFTPTSTSDTVRLAYGSDGSNYFTVKDFQLEEGNQVTSFAPYSNICPITGYTECEVESVGTNLANNVLLRNISAYTPNGDGYLKTPLDIPTGDYSAKFYGVITTGYAKIVNRTQLTEPVFLVLNGVIQDPVNFHVNDGDLMEFHVAGNDQTGIDNYFGNADLMLNKGNVILPYEPYHSSNATIQFGQTVYGGSVDFLTGVLTVTYGIVDLGTLNWTERVSGSSEWLATMPADSKAPVSRGIMAICSNYPQNHVVGAPSDKTMVVNSTSLSSTSKQAWIKDSAYTDAATFKTAMNGVQLVYELATPFTIQLTPQELQLLKGTNNITTNGTTINLDYIPDNSIGDAVKASEEYTDRAVKRVDLSEYMKKGVDYVTAGQLSGSTLGTKATAEGNNTVASGTVSHAEGNGTTAISGHAEGAASISSGDASHAEGMMTTANGDYSHSEGIDTKANGVGSHAEGGSTYASGDCSHAEGQKTCASGKGSHAEGGYSTATDAGGTFAIGENSHTEGYETYAYGQYAHAEGYQTSAYNLGAHTEGISTQTVNICSHAEGYYTTAFGTYTHAEGNSTYASGSNSHAEGKDTTAGGTSSHAEGLNTYTSGMYGPHAEGNYTCAIGNYGSHAEGYYTTAKGSYSHAEGRYAYAQNSGAHAEGMGTSTNYIIASGKGAHAEGFVASEGTNIVASGNGSHAEGGQTSALGESSHAEGYRTCAEGDFSHVEGLWSAAIGSNAHAEGYWSQADGLQSHAEGEHSHAKGDCSHAEGGYTTAFGTDSHAEGSHTYAGSSQSHAEGHWTSAYSSRSHAEGYYTCADNFASHVQGHYNAAMTTGGSGDNQIGTAFVIGNGTSSSNLSNAFSVQYDGTVAAASTITASTNADYAEFFEWMDGNPRNTDRVGYFVTTDKDDSTKITLASSEDDYILGITSGAPFVLGNGDCDVWNGMVMRDEFNRVIYIEPGVPKYNPDYDPTKPYVSRKDRKEWAAVGMLGVLPVHDDGTCQVGGFCTVGQRGYATKVDKYDRNGNCYKVIERVSDKVVKVIFR